MNAVHKRDFPPFEKGGGRGNVTTLRVMINKNNYLYSNPFTLNLFKGVWYAAVTGSPHSASLHTGYKGSQAYYERIGVWPLLRSLISDKSLFLKNYFLKVAPLG